MLPGLGKNRKRFQAFAVERAQIRKAEGSMQKDLFHYLVSNFLRLQRGVQLDPPCTGSLMKTEPKQHRRQCTRECPMER